MSDESKMVVKTEIAKPLYYQKLEKALDIGPFLTQAEEIFREPVGDDGDVTSESETELAGVDAYTGETVWNGESATKEDRIEDKKRLYNIGNVSEERQWLVDLLLSDTSSGEESGEEEITEADLQDMLKEHILKNKYRKKFYKNPKNQRYMYYGTGLLSNYDKYPEIQSASTEYVDKKRFQSHKKEKSQQQQEDDDLLLEAKKKKRTKEEGGGSGSGGGGTGRGWRREGKSRRAAKKKSAQSKAAEIMAHRRRKLWANMAKKEIGKVQRCRVSNHKEVLTACKRAATNCMRHCRQRAMQSQKNMKEVVWRAKRLTREMQVYWKRFERVERETRRRMEKEAEEQRKLDVELMEAKRQQRKLNFLITQTELYAHFMSRKLGGGSTEDQLRILSQLDEETIPRLQAIDDYNCEAEKEKLMMRVERVVSVEEARAKEFGVATPGGAGAAVAGAGAGGGGGAEEQTAAAEGGGGEDQPGADKPQPKIFRGTLKGYQIKGMTWLVNLYDQGINGILADEMGLGKTVQSIAFLCHIAEKYSVWGPFLIISPASTLHNWQQEMQRFVPDFKVVPYWGSQQERKILRQFWDQKGIHTKDASFHVVITSYQLVVSDIKYFNRIKWQYIILDEAQAIKSTNRVAVVVETLCGSAYSLAVVLGLTIAHTIKSNHLYSRNPMQWRMDTVRWKLLLGFNCRNRLLLSGTPIQNSMAELWALLHFIMPSMFDSHDEFNEWFSKDIESHAEHKTSIDEKHLSRLHMILKPFMLRRVKTDVENELSDKIEIMVYCPLTTRQKMLYSAVKKKIRIEDLIQSSGSSYQSAQSITSNLMNLVMQFRKVCNHPELFERREPRSPLSLALEDFTVPALITDFASTPRLRHLLFNLLSPFSPFNAYHSLFGKDARSFLSFTRIIGMSVGELNRLMFAGFLFRWFDLVKRGKEAAGWRRGQRGGVGLLPPPSYPAPLLFTSPGQRVFAHSTVILSSMPETLQHRIIRSKAKILANPQLSGESRLEPVFRHIPRKPVHLHCQPVSLPSFIYTPTLKVEVRRSRRLYSRGSRRWAWLNARLWGEERPYSWWELVWRGVGGGSRCSSYSFLHQPASLGLLSTPPVYGWSSITIPDKQTLVTDAGKLYVLDSLLTRLKEQGHRALIYSQMTRMIDLLEEYMYFRKHTFMRLDGSSKISERRDMVADFQTREDIFVFLLSTRAGGLGINLTAADTVIFYDSDWNPTVDQQAMDRAHRLGQTKQVTVYRLICKGTIEERILQRAQEKSEIQRVVISGGNFKPDTLKQHKEVVSLLLDDAEIEHKYRQKQEERKQLEESRQDVYRERERKRKHALGNYKDTVKHMKTEEGVVEVYQGVIGPSSPQPSGSAAASSSPHQMEMTGGGSGGTGGDGGSTIIEVSEVVAESPEDSAASSQNSPQLTRPFAADRGRSRRGRPPRSHHRSSISRPISIANMPPIALSNRSNKRGPGRPRLKPPTGAGGGGSPPSLRGGGSGGRSLRRPGRKPTISPLSIRPQPRPLPHQPTTSQGQNE